MELLQFGTATRQTLRYVCRSLDHQMANQALLHQSHISGSRDEHDHGVQAGKHLLGFLTLLLHTETKNGALQGIVSSYLNALVRLLKLQGPDSIQSQVLQDSLLVSLSVFMHMTIATTKTLSENHYDSIWDLASLSKKRNMITSCTRATALDILNYFISWQLLLPSISLRAITHATHLSAMNLGMFFATC